MVVSSQLFCNRNFQHFYAYNYHDEFNSYSSHHDPHCPRLVLDRGRFNEIYSRRYFLDGVYIGNCSIGGRLEVQTHGDKMTRCKSNCVIGRVKIADLKDYHFSNPCRSSLDGHKVYANTYACINCNSEHLTVLCQICDADIFEQYEKEKLEIK